MKKTQEMRKSLIKTCVMNLFRTLEGDHETHTEKEKMKLLIANVLLTHNHLLGTNNDLLIVLEHKRSRASNHLQTMTQKQTNKQH